MAKRALLIGCNYPGTKAELHGCVNDVSRMYKCLVGRFGFDERDITVLVDTDKRSVQPTGVNIKKVLGRLIDESVPGDVLVMHYSGHGTQVPDESGDADGDGLDEAIVPTDLNLLTDDDFRLLFNNIKQGVTFTFISDSCHSGGLIDHEKEQIGNGIGDTRGYTAPVAAQSATRSYGGGTRDFDAGYGGYGQQSSEYEGERRGYQEYGRREEQEYGGQEYGREERRGYQGRREEYDEEEPRRERYGQEEGQYGRRTEYDEEPRRERYGQEEGQYGRRTEYEEQPRRETYGGGYQEYGQEPSREGSGYQEGYGKQGYGNQEYGQRPGRREEGGGYGRGVNFNNKSLSLDTLTQMLSERVGHQVEPGNIRTSLYDMFGEDASPTVKVFVNLIASKLDGSSSGAQTGGGGIMGTIGSLAMEFLKTKLNDGDSNFSLPAPVASSAVPQSGYAGTKPPSSQRVPDDVGVLVSGCQSNETSADANPTGNPAQAYGALSNGIQTILSQTKGPITNGDLVRSVRALLQQQKFTQHPCLYCSDQNVDAIFIC
ncbi:unnamed protein product [Calypogeia fissa]